MKLNENPFDWKDNLPEQATADGLGKVIELFVRLQSSMEKQRDLIERYRKGAALDDSLMHAIDAAMAEVLFNGKPVLDGRYARGGEEEFHVQTTEHLSNRKRIWISTMTSSSLSLRYQPPSGEKRTRDEIAGQAISRIKKQLSNLAACSIRFRFTRESLLVHRRLSISRDQIFSEPHNSAGRMLDCARAQLDILSAIVRRMKETAIRASRARNADEGQQYQVEVSQLVDEVDRIASQAEFNYLPFFLGDFARESRTASLWFVAGTSPRRVFIPTMTAISLNLKRNDGSIITVSTPEMAREAATYFERAIAKIAKARNDLPASAIFARRRSDTQLPD